jgi:hypothetical protein
MMVGIYELCGDGVKFHDINIKFHKNWSRHSKVKRGDTQTNRQESGIVGLLLFCQAKGSGLKILPWVPTGHETINGYVGKGQEKFIRPTLPES